MRAGSMGRAYRGLWQVRPQPLHRCLALQPLAAAAARRRPPAGQPPRPPSCPAQPAGILPPALPLMQRLQGGRVAVKIVESWSRIDDACPLEEEDAPTIEVRSWGRLQGRLRWLANPSVSVCSTAAHRASTRATAASARAPASAPPRQHAAACRAVLAQAAVVEALLGRSLTHPHIVTVYAHGVSHEEVSPRCCLWRLLLGARGCCAGACWRAWPAAGPGCIYSAMCCCCNSLVDASHPFQPGTALSRCEGRLTFLQRTECAACCPLHPAPAGAAAQPRLQPSVDHSR